MFPMITYQEHQACKKIFSLFSDNYIPIGFLGMIIGFGLCKRFGLITWEKFAMLDALCWINWMNAHLKVMIW